MRTSNFLLVLKKKQALESLGCRETPSLPEKSSAGAPNKIPPLASSSSSGSGSSAPSIVGAAAAGAGVGSTFSAAGVTTASATGGAAAGVATNGGCSLPAGPFLEAIDELGPALTSLGVL